MDIFGASAKFEVEWFDLEDKQLGIICATKKGSVGRTARILLKIPPSVCQRIESQIERRQSNNALSPAGVTFDDLVKCAEILGVNRAELSEAIRRISEA